MNIQNYPQLKSNNEWGVLNINHENAEPEPPENADSSETQPDANENGMIILYLNI